MKGERGDGGGETVQREWEEETERAEGRGERERGRGNDE